jgi:hypothetical protein
MVGDAADFANAVFLSDGFRDMLRSMTRKPLFRVIRF